jgi:hypothetical protein
MCVLFSQQEAEFHTRAGYDIDAFEACVLFTWSRGAEVKISVLGFTY